MRKTLLISKENKVLLPANGLLRLALLCLIILAATTAFAQQPFITTWKTDNPGDSNGTTITIPTTGGGYNYEVDWNNDGTYDQSGITGNVIHDFGAAGTYTIRIRGSFPRIFFNDTGDRQKLLDVVQWGEIAWTSMQLAFAGCSNLNISATDLPILSGVTNMSGMFYACTSLNGPANIGTWNTASVTDMSQMFAGATVFNQPIGTWNTANVTHMGQMFALATAFNQPIGSWNTANVIRMSYMFNAATAFNQFLGNWNTANVVLMSYMFDGATAFNQSLGNWTLNSSVELDNILINSGMDCDHYSATLIGWNNNLATPDNLYLGATGGLYGNNAVAARTNLDIAKGWTFFGDAASGTDCSRPFITTWKTDNPGTSNSTSITIPIFAAGSNYEVDWDNDGIYDQSGITGNVTHDFGVAGTYTIRIRGAVPRIYFSNLNDKEKLLDVAQWGDIAWTSMFGAFWGCSNLNISATDVPNLSAVTSMEAMFAGCTILNGPSNIGEWNTANITNMSGLFSNSPAFNQPIGNWNTGNVIYMNAMFLSAVAFNQPIGNWNTTNVIDMNSLFQGALSFNQPIGSWVTANVTNMTYMFTAAVTFNQPIGNWNTANVTSMGYMFGGASAFNQPIGNWNTAKVNYTLAMFYGATAFNQPIGSWNTASVVLMNDMFNGATSFNQSLGNWPLASNVALDNMLTNSGMDCEHYSTTLLGWNNNPATPNNLSLGATGRLYGTNAVAAHTNLDVTKGWTFTGDAASGGDCSALPVTLISFTGKSQENGVLLTWETASETSNAGFEIEKSADARTFDKIGFVDGAGDSRVRKMYHFRDINPLPTTYYRLKQLDYTADGSDGKFEYSRIISVKQPKEKIVIYPNPTSNVLHLKGLSTAQNLVVKDADNKVVHKQLWSSGDAVKVGHLPGGLYFITVGGETKKIIVQKENR
ncbi:BspA family leucine-rich repeat surface protein [Dyadobacter aurulentus]|uniref:BspA family leucine-rich repeat surface protein n=1 Tax=Dyadobacter sp. UC 10 TaxID=2605428 RepID=UPI0011F226EF|nr:BspA family leucine-rich repeat surface protein [Dyadobacter sp. UC 10]KAA0989216.1 BspA family leucine-rich repeat surface protein [Dyadobacter sp. UC 10]